MEKGKIERVKGGARNCWVLVVMLVTSGCTAVDNSALYAPRVDEEHERAAAAKLAEHQPAVIIGHRAIPDATLPRTNWVFMMYNLTGKMWKYLDINVKPFNRVGDPMCELNPGTSCVRELRLIGPMEPKTAPAGFRGADGYVFNQFENVWFSNLVACAEIEEINVVFMDETTLRIERKDIPAMFAANSQRNSCRFQ